MKREEAGNKTPKAAMPAMAKRKAAAAGPGRIAGKMTGNKGWKGMAADMKVCEKPHDMEHYRLSDEDDACFDSIR